VSEELAPISLDALLCALTLAPQLYARNRFFELYQTAPTTLRVRRRAAVLRGIIRQLVGVGSYPARIVGEQVLKNGRVLIRYVIPQLDYVRTVSLCELEGSLLRYVVGRALKNPVPSADRERVEQVLSQLAPELPQPTLESMEP
jgi:hypothetical protein